MLDRLTVNLELDVQTSLTATAERGDVSNSLVNSRAIESLIARNVAAVIQPELPLSTPGGDGTEVTVRSCRYGAVLRACQMAIDADLNGVIANVRNRGTLETHGDPIGTDAGGATSPVRHWSNRTSRGRYFGSEIPARPNGYERS